MMLPRRVPFIGDVPLPMISSWPRSLISPTRTQTFDVPMSRATMYLSSVRVMAVLFLIVNGASGDVWTRGRAAGADSLKGVLDKLDARYRGPGFLRGTLHGP